MPESVVSSRARCLKSLGANQSFDTHWRNNARARSRSTLKGSSERGLICL